jgi:hypothetical protein
MSYLVLALRFALELCAVAALAVGGAELGGVPVAIALPVLGLALWSQLAAPKSDRRLADPARLVFELLFFAAAGAGLLIAGRAVLGIVLAGASAIVALLVRAMPGARTLT